MLSITATKCNNFTNVKSSNESVFKKVRIKFLTGLMNYLLNMFNLFPAIVI